MDASMQAMLGMFDFQKLMDLQRGEEAGEVGQDSQQEVPVSTPQAMAIPAPSMAQGGSEGGEEDDTMGDLIDMAALFFL